MFDILGVQGYHCLKCLLFGFYSILKDNKFWIVILYINLYISLIYETSQYQIKQVNIIMKL